MLRLPSPSAHPPISTRVHDPNCPHLHQPVKRLLAQPVLHICWQAAVQDEPDVRIVDGRCAALAACGHKAALPPGNRVEGGFGYA
eukprot:350706-Chlamydomonas_euryale.AAC.4